MWNYRTKGQEFASDRQPRLRNRTPIMRRLRRDENGTTAIEFAFVAIPLVYLLLGIVEFSMAMTVGNSLEAATNLSSRLGKTGFVDAEAGLDQEQTIYEEVERRVGPMIDMGKLKITNEVYNDFESLTNPDLFSDTRGDADGSPPDGDTEDPGEWTDVDGDGFRDGSEGIGTTGNIVVYRIMYPWQIMTPLIANIIGDDGIINLTAYSVVKNEPY
jgi:Flp pilus assembly pilin Flp